MNFGGIEIGSYFFEEIASPLARNDIGKKIPIFW